MPEDDDRKPLPAQGGTATSREPGVEPRAERLIAALAEQFPNEGVTIANWRRVAAKAMTATYRDRFLRIHPEAAVANVAAVVRHFAPDGLTTRQYLQAVLKTPLQLALKPETLIDHIEAVVRHFADNGLTTRSYIRAALRQPQLFHQNAHTIITNIEVLVRHFEREGLTLRDYLDSALKQPTLFTQKPETIASNIEAVVRHFAGDGLTARAYLRAAVKQPTLFYQKPSTLIANVETVVTNFTSAGLTTRDYLCAALKQPPLFSLKPRTVIGHINILDSMHRKSLLAIDAGSQALMDFIVEHPMLIAFADDNLHLREIAAHLTDDPTAPILRTRQYAEDTIGEALRRNDGNAENSHARRLLLNALRREGYLKGDNGRER